MKLKANIVLNGVIGAIYLWSLHWAFAGGLEETVVTLSYGFVFVTIIANALFLLLFGNKKN